MSIATVSRYINGKGNIAEETSNKIAEAIRKAGYRPGIRRPGRKTQDRIGVKTGIIIFLSIGRIESYQMLNHLSAYPMMLMGLQKYLIDNEMSLMFSHSSGSDDDLPGMLDSKYCDGVVVFGRDYQLGKRLRERLRRLPTVWCGGWKIDHSLTEFDQVVYDNSQVGRAAAEYLIGRGHRKTVYFIQKNNYPLLIERGQSFVAACDKHGLKAEIVDCDPSLRFADGIGTLAARFMQEYADATGAFFSTDDFMLGVCTRLQMAGYDLNRLDLVGCNNETQFLNHFDRRPATVDIRFEELGHCVAVRLHERIKSRNTLIPEVIGFEPRVLPAEKP